MMDLLLLDGVTIGLGIQLHGEELKEITESAMLNQSNHAITAGGMMKVALV